MWNSYWSGRSRRDLPQVNYNESSDEDDYNSPLVSPSRPPVSRAGSPVTLAVPTLSDNVDEELEAVSRTLRNVGHSHTFRGTHPVPGARPDPEGGGAQTPSESNEPDLTEEVVEGHVVGEGSSPKDEAGDDGSDGSESGNMPDEVDIAVENGQDGEKAQDLARSIKVEFDPQDIRFWFSQLEAEFTMATIKSQWLKKTVMQRNLPLKQREDVKSYLILTKTEAGNAIYKEIKDELLRLYAPKPQDSYHRALSRTMVGLPSQLGAQLVDDVCKKPKKFDGCCCPGHVQALWLLQLPINVRSHISNMAFTKDSYKQVFEAADKCYMSAQQVSVAAFAAGASASASGSKAAATGLDETLPAFQSHNQQQVAAFGQNNGQGQKKNKKNKNKNQNQGGSQENNQSRGKKHSSIPDNLADKMCTRHFRHGASAWFCVAPLTCPWASKVAARP